MAQVVGGVTAVGDATVAAGVCTAVGDVMGTGGVTAIDVASASDVRADGTFATILRCDAIVWPARTRIRNTHASERFG